MSEPYGHGYHEGEGTRLQDQARTFTAMVEGVRDDAVAAGLATGEAFEAGVGALRRTAEAGGVFCSTFFKAVGRRA